MSSLARHAVLAVAVLGVVLGACSKKQEITAPPPPLRPEAEPELKEKVIAKDCEPTNPKEELKPIGFDERSIPEANRLAEQGRAELQTSRSAEVDKLTRESYVVDAVQHFIEALSADPYNVPATYNLAAAYARIGRPQCSLNLLTRLLQLRPHASKRPEVEAMLDRLLGRRQPLDPDFSDMRSDERFRSLIRNMCEGTNDPNCVYGGAKR